MQVLEEEQHLKPVGFRHSPQVHRQMGGICNKGAIRAKQGTREVKALLDVHTDAGALQCAAHLLCNAHKPAQSVSNFHFFDLHCSLFCMVNLVKVLANFGV